MESFREGPHWGRVTSASVPLGWQLVGEARGDRLPRRGAKFGLRTVVTVKPPGRNKPETKSLRYQLGRLWLQIIACQMKMVHIIVFIVAEYLTETT